MRSEKTYVKLVFPVLCFFALIIVCGCGSKNVASTGTEGAIWGHLDFQNDSTVIVRGNSREWKVLPDKDGNFFVQVPAGSYQVLLKSADDKLSLINNRLVVEDKLTVRLLDITLVPIPSVTSVSVPFVTEDTAIIEWETDIESDGRVEYGHDQLYGYSSYADSDLKKNHRIQLNSLQSGTNYHFRIVASRHLLDIAQSISKDFSFTTEQP